MRFQTDLADERYRLVRMAVAGPGMAGTVEAFVRPEPVGAISFAEAARLVRPDQFANRRALIVGGSRGLGASSAKLLAAGGASVIVTYASGASEAAEICREIGGNCNAMPLDVTKPLAGQLATIAELPTHVYYFASPRIFLQKKPEFERSVFDRFLRFYVDAFAELCAWLTDRASTPVSVLYPSSIAVMERPAGLTEYAMAKAAGEILCADLMQLHANLVIQAPRLPRVLTDQTATVMIVESSSPESVLLPLLRG
ncbi:MAG: SDR family oxidoreductase [Sphingomicrobium sp.]